MSINQGNKIPHSFEIDQFVLAILKLLVVGSLKVEERLKDLKIFSFILHIHCFLIEFFKNIVRVLNDLW